MIDILEEIWENYKWEECASLHGERKIKHYAVSSKLEELLESLNEEQRKVFESYKELHNEYIYISEKECFIRGVKFGTSFIFDAICKRDY